jgi:putative hemolysin
MPENRNIINVKELIKSSDSGLKHLPDFVLSGIVRIIREDEINRVLTRYSDSMGVDFLTAMRREFNITIEIEGIKNLPESGRCFFVANHPFGFADGLVLTSIVAGKYGTLKAIGNELFLLVPQMRPLIAAVNVFGSGNNSRSYLVELDRVYNSDVPITHFPSGEVSRIKNGKIQDKDWEKSFISKVVSCKRDIVPIYIQGRNSLLFYLVFSFRKVIGVHATLESVLLPREFFNKRNKTIKVKIGAPVPYDTFDKTKTLREWAQWMKSRVYRLKDN